MEDAAQSPGDPLTETQQLLWLRGGAGNGGNTRGLRYVLEIQGPLDVPLLRECLSCLHRRHAALRARFIIRNGDPWQLTDEEAPLDFSVEQVAPGGVPRILEAESRRPFGFSAGPSFIARVLQISDSRHFLLLNAHPLVIDRWSYGLLLREMEELYRARCTAHSGESPAIAPSLGPEATQAQRSRQAARRFWRHRLRGAPALLPLPTDFPRPVHPAAAFDTVPFTIPWATSRSIRALCSSHEATPEQFLLSALQVLLSRYSGETDLVVGMPFRVGTAAGGELAIGNHTQHLPLRQRVSPRTPFTDLLANNGTRLREVAAHREYPFAEMLDASASAHVVSHAPIFQHLLVYLDERPELEIPGLDVVAFPGAQPTGLLDTTFTVYDSSAGFRGLINFNSGLFETSSVQRWADNFIVLLEAICAEPGRAIGSLPILHPAEADYIADCLDKTENPFRPAHPSLPAAFEAQVAKTPEAIAIRCGPETMTYADLNGRANAIAHRLLAEGVEPGALVGTCISRTADLIAGILAVLKIGAVYVPLNPADPPIRLHDIARRAQFRFALCDHATPGIMSLPGVLALVTSDAPRSASPPQAAAITPESLSHVVFAPAPTGTPEGVMVRHANVLALLEWTRSTYLPEDLQLVLCSTPLWHPPVLLEIWAPLTTGGSVALVPDATSLVRERPHGLTLINTAPAVLRFLIDEAAIPESVRVVNIYGEKLAADLISELFHRRPDIVAYNTYGQAEGTAYATFCRLTGPCGSDPPIGTPLPHEYSRVIDPLGNLVPLGAIGELCVGGAGVAAGYLNDPERTAARFRESRNYSGKRMPEYLTGDLVRLREDGKLHLVRRSGPAAVTDRADATRLVK